VPVLAVGWVSLTWLPSLLRGQDSTPPVPATPSEPRIILRPEPNPPTEGTIAWLHLATSSATAVPGGEAGGEPLHFQRSTAGRFRALLAIPVEIVDSLPVSIFLSDSGRTDTIVTVVPVRQAGYTSEVLSVAPHYARPDSAAAARIQSEIARSREISRQSQERPRIWRGGFRLPRPSRVTSPFGSARVFNGEVQSRHLGTDFAGAVGAPVRAAGRGVVAQVADFYLAGHAVYIDHGAGLVTGYFHLSRSYVAEGDTVVAGQRIGAVGKSGRVTGPHLHWIARYGAISVDPMSLLKLVNSKR
jgi:murein DD-endopeptidase MepM/ murein hydrolase activator NlpD